MNEAILAKSIKATTGLALIMGPVAALAVVPQDACAEGTYSTVIEESAVSNTIDQYISVANVQGIFGYSQGVLTPNAEIAKMFQKASVSLCGAEDELTVANAADWPISVVGDVNSSYSTTLGELAESNANTVIMGCACVSNTAGGGAAINAEVTGIPLATMVALAQPSALANTVTLVSEDGYRVSLPLWYVLERNSVISYSINDEPLEASVGGTNQLWIDSGAAKYFTRNIVAIEITAEDSVPAVPGTELPEEGEYVNRPNIGIKAVA